MGTQPCRQQTARAIVQKQAMDCLGELSILATLAQAGSLGLGIFG